MDSGQSMWKDSGAEGKALLPLPWPLLTLRTGELDTGHTPEGKLLTDWQMLAMPFGTKETGQELLFPPLS